MSATKEQERKALEKIKKIVAELGEVSYIGMAFEGCFEIAEENIENDFGCSMKQKAEAAYKEMEHFKSLAERLHSEKEHLEERVRKLEPKELTYPLQIKIHNVCIMQTNALNSEKAKLERTILANATRPESKDFKEAVQRYTEVNEEITDIENLIKTTVKMVEGRS